jgi:replicative DNA helicase
VWPLKTALHEVFDRIAKANARGARITGIPTGFDRYDRITSGLHDGELTIVAARPGMGKTSLVLNMAANVASPQELVSAHDPNERWLEPGCGVVVFSLEMPREQIVHRMLCSEAHVEVGKVRTGMLTKTDWEKLTQAAGRMAGLNIWVDDSPALGILDLRSKVRRLQAEFDQKDEKGERKRRIGLVVVDYLQLMRGREGAASREQEISEISRGLKQLAKELSLPVIALSQLNRAVETRGEKSKRPQLSDLRECVVGDTLVVLADGRRMPIRELVGREPEVIALDAAGKVVRAASDKVWRVGMRPVFDVVLASGRVLRATARHRVLGARGWVRVESLAAGDRLALARRVPEPAGAETWTEARAGLLGHLIGDGSYLTHQPLRYTTASEDNSAFVAMAARELGSTVTRHAGRGAWHQLVLAGNGNRWHPAGVNRWLRELGIYGQRSHTNDTIARLLRHLWATDGCIHVRSEGRRGSASVYLATASRALAQDVGALLMRLGVLSRIREVLQGRHRPVYNVAVSGADAQRRFLAVVGAFGPRTEPARKLARALEGVTSNPNVDTLPHDVFDRVKERMKARGVTQRAMAQMRGTLRSRRRRADRPKGAPESYGGTSHFRFAPSRATLASYATLLEDDQLLAAAESDVFWDTVVRVEPAGEEEVFDLTVPGPSNWLADGIVSHNSGAIEQDADNICFIYRDDYYNKETADRNVAELIVAKQRNGPTDTVRVRFDAQYTRFDNLAEGEHEGYDAS